MLTIISFHSDQWVSWSAKGAAVLAFIIAVAKFAQWTWGGTKTAISAAVDVSETGHLVNYHLGPNGSTIPLHQRVINTRTTEQMHHAENSAVLSDISARLLVVENKLQEGAPGT